MKRVHAPRFFAPAAFAAVFAVRFAVCARTLVALGNPAGALSESLARESLAAADRAVDAMAAHAEPGDERLAACLAAASSGADGAAGDAAEAAARRLAALPWSGGDASRAAFAAFAASLCGRPLPAVFPERLSRAAETGALSPGAAVLAFLALDAASAGRPGAERESAARWDRLAERRPEPDPRPADVAARAVARGARARARGAEEPGPDVLAHARWLSARLFSGGGPGSGAPGGAPGRALDPETAFLAALLADGLPRRVASPAGGGGPFPADWRSRVADALVSAQVADPGAGASWSGPDATAFAVLALFLVAL